MGNFQLNAFGVIGTIAAIAYLLTQLAEHMPPEQFGNLLIVSVIGLVAIAVAWIVTHRRTDK